MARSLTPMLFSFTDREASPTLTARVGTGLHVECKPHWCQHFPLQKGVRVRSFLVSPRDGRPELVYLVGISIRSGRGRYRDTQIVTLAPCYQLYNQSSWTLEVFHLQRTLIFERLPFTFQPGVSSLFCHHLYRSWSSIDLSELSSRLPFTISLASFGQKSIALCSAAKCEKLPLVGRFCHPEH